MYMGILATCLSLHHVCLMPLESKEGTGYMELDLQIVVSLHMGAGNQCYVLWKSSQSSQLLSHLSSFHKAAFIVNTIIFSYRGDG